MERKFRVGISGSYGGLNLGDEAILQCMIRELRKSVSVDITVFTRDSDDTMRRHRVDRAVPVREASRNEIARDIEQLDLFVLGGGGILYDEVARTYIREVELANELGVPVMVYAVGAGPLKDPAAQGFVRNALDQVALVTVRERYARTALEEAGLQREVIVTADPGFLMEPEPLPDDALQGEGLAGKERLVALSVREPGGAAPDLQEEVYHQLVANAADFIVDRFDAHAVFVPMEYRKLDIQHSHAVIAKMLQAKRATVLKGEYTSGQVLTLMKQFEFAVGMRLHFLIFAALQGTPFVALPYASKVSGILESLGIAVPPLQKVNAGRLNAYIDRFWDTRDLVRESLRQRVDENRIQARETNRRLVELITDIARQKKLLKEIQIAPASSSR